MRIAMVSSYYAPYLIGGAEIYLKHLVTELTRRGHDVHFITNNPGKPHDDARVANLNVRPNVAMRALLVPQPSLVRGIREELRRFNPDVVHVHCTHTTLGLSPFPALRARPAVATMHDYSLFCLNGTNTRVPGRPCNDRRYCYQCAAPFYTGEMQRQAPQLARTLRAIISRPNPLHRALAVARNAGRGAYLRRVLKRVVCPSEAVRETMRIWGFPESQLEVVPNGIPDPGVLHAVRHTGEEMMTIGFVGRLVPAKGVNLLVDATARLRAKGYKVQLIVAGDGESRTDLQRQAAAVLGDGYEFCGWIDSGKMEEVYRRIDVLAFPSTGVETFGIALLEAMGRGIPVAGANIGGIAGVLQDGAGALFDSGSVASLTNVLERFISIEYREQMSNAARQAFVRRFTIDRNVDAIENIYRGAMARA
jgi:glycosyltransferase involved in cell wall biosynthesis